MARLLGAAVAVLLGAVAVAHRAAATGDEPKCIVDGPVTAPNRTVHVRNLPPGVRCVHRTDNYHDLGWPDAYGNIDFAEPVAPGTAAHHILLEWYADYECRDYLPGSDTRVRCTADGIVHRPPCDPNPCNFGGECKHEPKWRPAPDGFVGYWCECKDGSRAPACKDPRHTEVLFAGGLFDTANVLSANNTAFWTGKVFERLGGLVGGNVTAFALFKGHLYAGGAFDLTQAPPHGHLHTVGPVVRWDGRGWEPVDAAQFPGAGRRVNALAVYHGELYAGGYFGADDEGPAIACRNHGRVVNNIARWDGHRWHNVSGGVNGEVFALAVYDGRLYVGGAFTAADGQPAYYIAAWNGTHWAALEGGGTDGTVYALAAAAAAQGVYVGGNFTFANAGLPVNHVALYRPGPATWHALGGGLDGAVLALAVNDTAVYVGGQFHSANNGTLTLLKVALWTGQVWDPLGAGVEGDVHALAIRQDVLYIGGDFVETGPVLRLRVNHLAAWRLFRGYETVGTGTDGPVYALLPYRHGLAVGGLFGTAGNITAPFVAQLNEHGGDGQWTGLAGGTNGLVNSLVAVKPPRVGELVELYASGFFSAAGGLVVNFVARWDGCRWSRIGSGADTTVTDLAYDPTRRRLFACGLFTAMDGRPANYTAVRENGVWRPLGVGTNNAVTSITVLHGHLFAGGSFTEAGRRPANYIARWDGAAWSALGPGVDAPVEVVAVYRGHQIVAGGQFTHAGNLTVNYIARWDGHEWSPLGAGADHFVIALLDTNMGLFAGGFFTAAGGTVANHVARWDGYAWHALRGGVDNGVNALALYQGQLVVGGFFHEAGGVAANNIALWDGGRWRALPYEVYGEAVVALETANIKARHPQCGGNNITVVV